MKALDIFYALSRVSYPGRGLVMGLSGDGRRAAAVYFIMGRSRNSRNRVFELRAEGLYTRAADERLVTDPSLILYRAMAEEGGRLIVSNGDQTDTICETLKRGGSFDQALRSRTFEPDAPNYTPRIAGLLSFEKGTAAYRMGIVKAGDSAGQTVRRCFFEYEGRPGIGHYLHTYQGDGDPLPAFSGEPEEVLLPAQTEKRLARSLFEALNRDNRIALCLVLRDLSTGRTETEIVNAYGEEDGK